MAAPLWYHFVAMAKSNLLRSLRHLEIEEKILNGCAFIALVGVFMPWFGGTWYGEPTVWTGFGFYTSFVGLLIFLSHAFIITITVLNLLGYQVMRSGMRETKQAKADEKEGGRMKTF